MEAENIKIQLIGDSKEVVIRTGEALELKEPRIVEITGSIDAPVEFAKKRDSEIEPLNTHVIVDKENGTIELIIDEKNQYRTKVKGGLTPFTNLAKLGINEDRIYSPRQLYEKLKFFGMYFKNRDQHISLCDKLTKFTGRIETDFTNSNDFKGNVAHQKLVKIKTDLDLKFVLACPVYKGGEPQTFEVDICIDAKDGGVFCWLESVDLHEQKVRIIDESMKAGIEALSKYVTIYI